MKPPQTLTITVDAKGNTTSNWLPRVTLEKRLRQLEKWIQIQRMIHSALTEAGRCAGAQPTEKKPRRKK